MCSRRSACRCRWTSSGAGACLAATGFTFLFAPHYHPAMKAIAPVRAALGVRTVFNILGPLTNPAAAAVPPDRRVQPRGGAASWPRRLPGMPIERTFVVHGAEGWDEPTPDRPVHAVRCAPGSRASASVRAPADYGLEPCTRRGSGRRRCRSTTPRRCARCSRARTQGAHRDCLLLGAALALEVAGVAAEPHAARRARRGRHRQRRRPARCSRRLRARSAARRQP